MHDKLFALFDAIVVGIPVIGFCVWQLISVNRELKRDRSRREASEDAARHPVGEHGLDHRGGEAP